MGEHMLVMLAVLERPWGDWWLGVSGGGEVHKTDEGVDCTSLIVCLSSSYQLTLETLHDLARILPIAHACHACLGVRQP